MIDRDDRELRDAFARLRAEDLTRHPLYGEVRRLEKQPRSIALHSRLSLALVMLGLTVSFTSWRFWLPRHSSEVTPLDSGLGSSLWRAPTDFLLDTPGRDLLRAVPPLGATTDIVTVPQLNRTTERTPWRKDS